MMTIPTLKPFLFVSVISHLFMCCRLILSLMCLLAIEALFYYHKKYSLKFFNNHSEFLATPNKPGRIILKLFLDSKTNHIPNKLIIFLYFRRFIQTAWLWPYTDFHVCDSENTTGFAHLKGKKQISHRFQFPDSKKKIERFIFRAKFVIQRKKKYQWIKNNIRICFVFQSARESVDRKRFVFVWNQCHSLWMPSSKQKHASRLFTQTKQSPIN